MKFYFGAPSGDESEPAGQWYAAVVCQSCFAQGPLCCAELRKDATKEAVALWNGRRVDFAKNDVDQAG
ncbi:MAG: hypothetical protein HQL64_09660 [Magnetococcales bacterium]|nr:hypothetical protein [Magnetococcales bacterium]